MYLLFGKRILDILISIFAIIILMPIWGIIILIFFLRKEKPFFVQERPGLHEKPFQLYKFRTMKSLKPGENPHSAQRVTSFGKILRKTSLDETLQFWNILKGEMSFVGPRPLLTEYLALYTQEERKRHQVKPGLTGYAQIKGRNELSWKKKFEYDVYYAENVSFWLDLWIILMTTFALKGVEPPNPYDGKS